MLRSIISKNVVPGFIRKLVKYGWINKPESSISPWFLLQVPA